MFVYLDENFIMLKISASLLEIYHPISTQAELNCTKKISWNFQMGVGSFQSPCMGEMDVQKTGAWLESVMLVHGSRFTVTVHG